MTQSDTEQTQVTQEWLYNDKEGSPSPRPAPSLQLSPNVCMSSEEQGWVPCWMCAHSIQVRQVKSFCFVKSGLKRKTNWYRGVRRKKMDGGAAHKKIKKNKKWKDQMCFTLSEPRESIREEDVPPRVPNWSSNPVFTTFHDAISK